MVMLETCNEICNTIDNLNGRICVLNKTKTGNINLSHMAKRINEAKALTKHISCDCKCKFDGKVVYKVIAISAVVSAIRYCFCKRIIFGILAYAIARLLNILKTILANVLLIIQ